MLYPATLNVKLGSMTSVSDMVAVAADELIAAAEATDETRTIHLRALAEAMADIRALCADPFDRGPDWSGRSKEYRDAITGLYRSVEEAVWPETLRQIKSQVRYHLSSVVRARLADDPKALDDYGLLTKSVRDRTRDRARQRRALEDAGILDSPDVDSSAASRLVHGARRLVALAAEEGTAELTLEAREYVRDGMRELLAHAASLTNGPDRIALARDLISSVEPVEIRGLPADRRTATDVVLTELLDGANKLIRETTTATNDVAEIDRLLSRLSAKQAKRRA